VPRLKAWAVAVGGDRLHVLVLDKGNRPASLALSLPASGPATVQRLIAPAVSATRGVTLGGQWLTRAARWAGSPVSDTVYARHGSYHVHVGRYSAALIDVRLANRTPR
jgi:hypothetical protein